MYIYDNVVILSSMWYVLRFVHARAKTTCSQTTCSLGGTASLGFGFYLISFLQFFSRKRLILDGLLTLLWESGRHSKSSVKAVVIFLFLAMKSTLITMPCTK